ncbi:MAG: hypothetical protein L0Y44_09035 [Phycisphaerales bacterium]|nr:hypothetical protein [Phycisphaerales bacterium]
MASISKSSPAPGKGGPRNPRARKAQAISEERTVAVALSVLIDVQDEVAELGAMLRIVPGLDRFAADMKEIRSKPSMDAADVIDLNRAGELIVAGVECRLARLGELVGRVGQ